jgi:hemerythrin
MLLQWSDKMKVGHKVIDYDHQMLFNIANDLHHTVNAQGPDAIGKSLERLVHYIETHFAREEDLFCKTDYPNAEKHKKNHRDIENLVHEFSTAFASDPHSVDMERLLGFLKEWLVKHIGQLDKGYIPYVIKAEKKLTYGHG